MSDTLLDYAQPLIDLLPDDHGPEELKAMLLFASLFWNAVGEAEEDLEEAVPILARKLVHCRVRGGLPRRRRATRHGA